MSNTSAPTSSACVREKLMHVLRNNYVTVFTIFHHEIPRCLSGEVRLIE